MESISPIYIRRWSSPHGEPCNDISCPNTKKNVKPISLMQLKHDRDGDNQKVEDVPGSPQVSDINEKHRPKGPGPT